MENIIEISDSFDFTKLNLENPSPLQGGNFFTKLNYTDKRLPLYVQLPKCLSKHGIIKSVSSKKSYIDLLFPYFDSDVLTWFENLESKCRELIYNKKDVWFQTNMDLDDIENMFISPTKSYKSGKFIMVRAHIPCTKQIKKSYCMIYDENERILEPSSITELTELIPLICIDGIKFSSKSFQLDINLPQIMIISVQEDIKNGFLIKRDKPDSLENPEVDTANSVEIADNKPDTSKNVVDDSNELKTNKMLESEEKFDNAIVLATNNDLEKTDEVENNDLEKTAEVENKNLEDMQEIDLHIDDTEAISLKKPIEVYYEIYKAAREKAKHMKQAAIEAYLDARNIKTKYMLDEINNSEDGFSNFSEIEE